MAAHLRQRAADWRGATSSGSGSRRLLQHLAWVGLAISLTRELEEVSIVDCSEPHFSGNHWSRPNSAPPDADFGERRLHRRLHSGVRPSGRRTAAIHVRGIAGRLWEMTGPTREPEAGDRKVVCFAVPEQGHLLHGLEGRRAVSPVPATVNGRPGPPLGLNDRDSAGRHGRAARQTISCRPSPDG